MSAIETLTAFELAEAYRARALSPVDVAKRMLALIDQHEPRVNAFSHRDDAGVIAAATASEARWMAGESLSAVDGVPVTIKDNILARGWPARRGSAVASLAPSADDAPATQRFREAGAILLGKTTMPEYGWKGTSDSPATGITRNPWNLDCTTGGSSAGAAAAASLGIGRLHIGTDGAGSVRIPAAFCGLAGLKPTFGRVPAWPVSTMGVLAHLGPLARTVREAALAMNIVARPDDRDLMATLADRQDYLAGIEAGVRGLTIAYSPRLGYVQELDPEIEALTAKAARLFADLGAHVEQADPDIADPIEPLMVIWAAGAALALRDIPEDDRQRMDPGLVALAEEGARISAATYIDALLYQRNALALRMARFHARYDLLLTPSMPLPAFEAGRLTPGHGRYGDIWTNWSPYTYPFNLTQQPAISVPSGLTSGGMPAGLQIIGRFGEDSLVLRAARAFEAVMPALRPPAAVSNPV